MSGIMIKMHGNREKSAGEIADELIERLSAEMVGCSRRELGDMVSVLIAFEKYYFRNGSYASLTVMLTEQGEKQTADIVGFGGGEGIFNLSWGANQDFADIAAGILEEYGFHRERQG